ncbi:MAG: radical SAM protein [Candidatus Fermentibacteraceae bacterium]|nr:radical SAM protein [Candidatus Fermentibacteraceae bacterium]MBN2609162.1 radical SAM protein [Candidatus Fermentibacteraceae bacterium]
MECTVLPDSGFLPFRDRLYLKAVRQRVPVFGSIEFTSSCNLKCVHCYIAGEDRNDSQLSLEQLKDITDQLADAGCLWLLITGGEPLFRKDFHDIYRYVRERGIIPVLFTNGTLVTDETADFLASFPPYLTEISIYGASKETYEGVTRVPGSYEMAFRGIERLLDRGLRLFLKTMAMKSNLHEVEAMAAIAADYGVPFRFDTLLNKGLDGQEHPLGQRITVEETLALEAGNDQRRKGWLDLAERFSAPHQGGDLIYMCGAGTSTFHIDPAGRLSVCILSRQESYDLLSGTFLEGWDSFLPKVISRKWSRDVPCRTCRLKSVCGQCPGWGYLEHGDPEARVEYLCSLAEARARELGLQDARVYDMDSNVTNNGDERT